MKSGDAKCEMQLVKYPEYHATVLFQNTGTSVSFEVFQWYGLPSKEIPEPTFRGRGPGEYETDTTDLSKSLRWFTGNTKWDGCTNINFHPDESGIHLCGGSDLQKFTELLKVVFRECHAILYPNAEDSDPSFEIEAVK